MEVLPAPEVFYFLAICSPVNSTICTKSTFKTERIEGAGQNQQHISS